MTIDEADALPAEHAFGSTPDYAGWRADHLEAEDRLKRRGLMNGDHGPHRARLSRGVRFNLDPSADVLTADT